MVVSGEIVVRFLIGSANMFLAGLSFWQYCTSQSDRNMRKAFLIMSGINGLSALYLIVGMGF